MTASFNALVNILNQYRKTIVSLIHCVPHHTSLSPVCSSEGARKLKGKLNCNDAILGNFRYYTSLLRYYMQILI